MVSPSVLTWLGIAICLALFCFVLVKVHRETISAPMTGTILLAGIITAVAFANIGGRYKAKLPGGAQLEGWAREAQEAAESTGVDRQEVAAIEKRVDATAADISTTAANLRELEERYRRILGDSTSLTVLMWKSRGMMGRLPPATSGEMDRLANNLMVEAYPNPQQRQEAWDRTSKMSAFAQDTRMAVPPTPFQVATPPPSAHP